MSENTVKDQRCTALCCTVEDHLRCERAMYSAGHRDGHRAGVLDGHRTGFDQGYLSGFNDGTRSSAAFKSGEANGFVTGYLERIGDELAVRGGAQ